MTSGWASSARISDANSHSPAAVLNSSAADLGTYHGDLVLSNALVPGMGNLPPLVPRDLGVCMVPLVLWAFVRALAGRSRTGLLAAGSGGGLAFLCAPLAGIFLALWAALISNTANIATTGIPVTLVAE